METYRRTRLKQKLQNTESLKALCGTRQNHQKRSKKPQEKSHRKTGRNSRNVTLGLYITSQNKFVEKYFTGKRKVKYENGNILHQEDQVERWKEHFCFVLNRENTANIKMNNQQN